MNPDLVPLLQCIQCGGDLALHDARESAGRVESGTLRCDACASSWPIVGFIPRFVPAENYGGNFGVQWNRFRRTQLDSASGTSITRNRFFETTGWDAEQMRGRRVLDVGCGAGRFAEIALSTGARVLAVDLSSAVEACRDNLLADHPSLDILQGDVNRLPLKPAAFEYVYCLGVLQHTPDPARAFASLCTHLAPGARIAVDVYPHFRFLWLWPKYWLRPITRRMKTRTLLGLVEKFVPWLLPVSDALAAVPLVGRKLRYVVPVMNYRSQLPLSEPQLREWAVLDTFDMFSPTYDQPQTERTLREWLERAGLRETEVLRRGFLIGRGRR